MRKKRVIQAGKCYHLVSRVAHRAYFFDDEEKDRFVLVAQGGGVAQSLLEKPTSPLQRHWLLRKGKSALG